MNLGKVCRTPDGGIFVSVKVIHRKEKWRREGDLFFQRKWPLTAAYTEVGIQASRAKGRGKRRGKRTFSLLQGKNCGYRK